MLNVQNVAIVISKFPWKYAEYIAMSGLFEMYWQKRRIELKIVLSHRKLEFGRRARGMVVHAIALSDLKHSLS